MCTNKTWITTDRGRKILVPCGHCPACLQQKAAVRSSRIRNNSSPYYVPLFLTLTYRNNSCPYILRSDLENPLNIKQNIDYVSYIDAPVSKNNPLSPDLKLYKNMSARMCSHPDNMVKYFRDIPIYRDTRTRWVRKKGKHYGHYAMRKRVSYDPHMISEFSVPLGFEKGYFKNLRKYDDGKIGVCYYPDLQNFIKNLRNVLQRNFKIPYDFSFYACSEYGPSSCRPHFHLLLFVPTRLTAIYAAAARKAWTHDSYRRGARFCEIAKDASGYVSSYVNCDTSIPRMFTLVPEVKPTHSYSQGFGMGLEYLQLPKILEAYERRDLHVDVTRLRKGVLVVDRVLLPQYAIHRFFPKFKGYYKLTTAEIQSILLRPNNIARFKIDLELDEQELHAIQVRIANKQKLFTSYGYSVYDFALVGSRIWTIYSANVLQDFYNSLDLPQTNFQAYDNIRDLFEGSVSNESLENMMFALPPNYRFEDDPNMFIDNLSKTGTLEYWYYQYTKDKKVRNGIYSKIIHI